jgi:hypothetical protein
VTIVGFLGVGDDLPAVPWRLAASVDDRPLQDPRKRRGPVPLASSGDFSPGYVRGIIKDSDQLTDVQKDKMMLQFGGLYD